MVPLTSLLLYKPTCGGVGTLESANCETLGPRASLDSVTPGGVVVEEGEFPLAEEAGELPEAALPCDGVWDVPWLAPEGSVLPDERGAVALPEEFPDGL